MNPTKEPEEEWKTMKKNIHSSFLVMLHSKLAFPKKTAGETAKEVIKVFEEYAFPVILSQAKSQGAREALEQVKEISDIGHNEDCIFCGLKDKKVLSILQSNLKEKI